MDTVNWVVILVLPVASLAMVFFAYFGFRSLLQIEDILPRWARERGFRIVHSESRMYSQGPFSGPLFFRNQYRPVYRVIIEDQQKTRKQVWVRLGWWYIVGFREKIEERWEE